MVQDWEHRREEDRLLIERLLIIIHNIMNIQICKSALCVVQDWEHCREEDLLLIERLLIIIHDIMNI